MLSRYYIPFHNSLLQRLFKENNTLWEGVKLDVLLLPKQSMKELKVYLSVLDDSKVDKINLCLSYLQSCAEILTSYNFYTYSIYLYLNGQLLIYKEVATKDWQIVNNSDIVRDFIKSLVIKLKSVVEILASKDNLLNKAKEVSPSKAKISGDETKILLLTEKLQRFFQGMLDRNDKPQIKAIFAQFDGKSNYSSSITEPYDIFLRKVEGNLFAFIYFYYLFFPDNLTSQGLVSFEHLLMQNTNVFTEVYNKLVDLVKDELDLSERFSSDLDLAIQELLDFNNWLQENQTQNIERNSLQTQLEQTKNSSYLSNFLKSVNKRDINSILQKRVKGLSCLRSEEFSRLEDNSIRISRQEKLASAALNHNLYNLNELTSLPSIIGKSDKQSLMLKRSSKFALERSYSRLKTTEHERKQVAISEKSNLSMPNDNTSFLQNLYVKQDEVCNETKDLNSTSKDRRNVTSSDNLETDSQGIYNNYPKDLSLLSTEQKALRGLAGSPIKDNFVESETKNKHHTLLDGSASQIIDNVVIDQGNITLREDSTSAMQKFQTILNSSVVTEDISVIKGKSMKTSKKEPKDNDKIVVVDPLDPNISEFPQILKKSTFVNDHNYIGHTTKDFKDAVEEAELLRNQLHERLLKVKDNHKHGVTFNSKINKFEQEKYAQIKAKYLSGSIESKEDKEDYYISKANLSLIRVYDELVDIFKSKKDFHSQVILVNGTPGVGKSFLTSHLVKQLSKNILKADAISFFRVSFNWIYKDCANNNLIPALNNDLLNNNSLVIIDEFDKAMDTSFTGFMSTIMDQFLKTKNKIMILISSREYARMFNESPEMRGLKSRCDECVKVTVTLPNRHLRYKYIDELNNYNTQHANKHTSGQLVNKIEYIESVSRLVAMSHDYDFRKIKGLLTQLEVIDTKNINKVIAKEGYTFKEHKYSLSSEGIVQLLATALNFPTEKILGKEKDNFSVTKRDLCIFFLRFACNLSLQKMAKLLHKSSTTMYKHSKKVINHFNDPQESLVYDLRDLYIKVNESLKDFTNNNFQAKYPGDIELVYPLLLPLNITNNEISSKSRKA